MPCHALATGSKTFTAASRTGESTEPRALRTGSSGPVPGRSTTSRVTAVSRSRSSVKRERPERRVYTTNAGSGLRVRGEQDALQRLELLQRLTRADGDAAERVLRGDDRHAGLVAEPGLEAVEQCATAGEDDALLHDVGGQLGRRLVEGHLDRIADRGDRLGDGLADLGGGGDDRLGQPGDEVATADLGVELLLERPCGSESDLHLLGGALAEGEAVLLLDELDDRVVELVAADADRLAG